MTNMLKIMTNSRHRFFFAILLVLGLAVVFFSTRCDGERECNTDFLELPQIVLSRHVEALGGAISVDETCENRFYRIRLNDLGLRADGLDPLFRQRLMSNVRHLEIGRNPIGDEGLARLGTGEWVAGLNILVLSSVGATDVGVETLVGNPRLRPSSLAIYHNQIGPDGVRALADSPLAAELRRLSIGGNPIGDEGARFLANGGFVSLENLGLGWSGLTDEGAREIIQSDRLDQLQSLVLNNNTLTEDIVELLLDPNHLPALRTFTVTDLVVSTELLDELAEVRPELHVLSYRPR